MTKPILLTVDDEPHVLNAIERDLRARYAEAYRVLKANSGAQALELTREVKGRGEPLALFLVDQRMPGMSGTEFLAKTQDLFPDSRKVLLTAYADTDAAIASINQIGLDYYLVKPWDPPEQHLYPVLDDLLGEWQAAAKPPYDGIRVVGTQWSPASHYVKDFLARNRVPYQWLDMEKDSGARALVEGIAEKELRLPVVFLLDGTILQGPERRLLADHIGLHTEAEQPFYDLIIVGAGPAGLGAAVYGASECLRTLMIERQATGGQAGTSSRIENYLGFPKGISGGDLARRATDQALRLGAEILTAREVCRVRLQDRYRVVELQDGSELTCRAMVIASGASVRTLDRAGIEELTGAGVYYGAALTEAANYSDQDVFVVGGANSAGQGAMFFSRFARKVTMLVRSSSLEKGMSQYLVNQIQANPKIEVRLRTVIESVAGNGKLESLTLRDLEHDRSETLAAAAVFIFIGAVPHSECVADLVECNHAGFIVTGPDLMLDGSRPRGWMESRDPYLLETSVPGIFAAGDVRQGAVRRVASAVGEGAIAVSLVHQYLRTV
ncbi:MAG: FAD-dependent oxidoreductase [Anaerolineales bacterium]